MKTEEVLKEVLEERYRQEQKWGEQNHIPAEYNCILVEEVGEVSKAIVEAHFSDADWAEYRKELIQVAAVAVAMVECYDRNKNSKGQPICKMMADDDEDDDDDNDIENWSDPKRSHNNEHGG